MNQRTSPKWCSCGYKNRGGGHHEEGQQHKEGIKQQSKEE